MEQIKLYSKLLLSFFLLELETKDLRLCLNYRSRETQINLLFKFVPEKLSLFKKFCRNLSVFKTGYFVQFAPAAKLVRSPVAYVETNIVIISVLLG